MVQRDKVGTRGGAGPPCVRGRGVRARALRRGAAPKRTVETVKYLAEKSFCDASVQNRTNWHAPWRRERYSSPPSE